MPRQARRAPSGVLIHVITRAADRRKLVAKAEDYAAFMRVMDETISISAMRVYGFRRMPMLAICLARARAGRDL